MNSTKETILAVEGMTCGSCVRHVGGALRALDGIDDVKVEIESGRVRVQHDGTRAPVAKMIDALEDAGYPSRPISG